MLKPHDHVLDYVDDYLHEVLSAADAAYVERHCEGCRVCKVALEEARKRFTALESLPAREASGTLIQATLERIDRHEQRRRQVRKYVLPTFFLATAAAVAFLGAVHLYFLHLAVTPYDLQVFGQTELHADAQGSLRVRLINRQTGAPLAGVPIQIDLHGSQAQSPEFVHLVRFTTDPQGTGQPRFQLPDWADGSYQLRVVADLGDGDTEMVQRTVRLQRSWKLMLTSDKPVYQPGQTIRLRALALHRPQLKPVAGRDVTFAITDPKGNVIFKRQDVTSTYGIASAECPLAGEILEGPYAIACHVGDTESKLTVDVQKYVLPKFKVGVELDQPYYQPGQRVRGTVQADYFFGKPVADGTVAVEVRTTDVAPMVLQRLSARTNGAGAASFEFALPETLVGREQDSGDARIALQVSVSDTAGQTQTKVVSRVVTAQPLRVEVIPEAGTLVEGVANTIFLFAGYPDGRPARVRLAVSGVERELVTNALGVASFELTPEADRVELTVRAVDEQGRVGRRQVPLACGPGGEDFLVRTDKAVYDGGDTVRLVALGGGSQPVFVDFLKDGQTILTETLAMADGRGEYQLDLPPDLFGTVELCAYRFHGTGLPVRKTRALYIRQARQLTIQATLDHAEYRPGGSAKLQLALTDHQGKPTPGAISLAAVDEAVFAVLDQAPGMERAFYLLEQELLRPVYAIYPWSPDLTTSVPPAERNRFEQALFARTWQTVGGAQPIRLPQRGPGRMPNETVRAGSPHSLAAESFPLKQQQTEQARQRGLERVQMGWTLLAAALAFAGYVTLWIVVRPQYVVALHLAAFLVCGVALMRPRSGRIHFAPAGASLAAPTAMAPDVAWAQGFRMKTAPGTDQDAPAPVRIRELFPETLLWRPELISDDQGRASLDVDLADSITTWRLTASAVAADGRLGAVQSSIRVFQPFFVDLNLPVALTRGDEVAVPVVVYNYLDRPQTVELALEDAPWFERLEGAAQRIDLAAGEVRSTAYRLRVTKVGNHHLQVTARGAGVADALKRAIEVVPDGRRVEQVWGGTLGQPAEITLSVPPGVIEGSPRAIVKVYPSSFSQLVEGLDAIFRMPSGCFEQTSSTTYPNVLALDYLRRTKKSVPEVEAKARQYIHLGYQRLLGFEVAGGGFDWFGRPPANRRLTAYGLMEFVDMAQVHDVDPKLIERTRNWLLTQQNKDGTWSESPGPHAESDPARGHYGHDLARYSTTAYIAWAVFGGREWDFRADLTRSYLLSRSPETIDDPYVLALACNALVALRAEGVGPYLQRLDSLKRTSEDGKLAWWEQPQGTHTTFHGTGRSGSIETTALAVLALLHYRSAPGMMPMPGMMPGGLMPGMMQPGRPAAPSSAGADPGTLRGALAWLVQQKDPSGTWHSTQATVLALKALLAGTGTPLGGDRERRIEVALGNGVRRTLVIPADQAEVMQQVDLSEHVGVGEHRLTLTEPSGTAAGYQVTFRYHVPAADRPAPSEPLAIALAYDRTDLTVGDSVTATATVVNQMPQVAPMVLLDLPIPAGFAVATEDFAKLVGDGLIAKYQLNPRSVIVYLRGLEPGKPGLTLRYQLRATMPVKVTVPPARAYEYYDPDKRGVSPAARLTVTQRR
jgi:hypothetical protein